MGFILSIERELLDHFTQFKKEPRALTNQNSENPNDRYLVQYFRTGKLTFAELLYTIKDSKGSGGVLMKEFYTWARKTLPDLQEYLSGIDLRPLISLRQKCTHGHPSFEPQTIKDIEPHLPALREILYRLCMPYNKT